MLILLRLSLLSLNWSGLSCGRAFAVDQFRIEFHAQLFCSVRIGTEEIFLSYAGKGFAENIVVKRHQYGVGIEVILSEDAVKVSAFAAQLGDDLLLIAFRLCDNGVGLSLGLTDGSDAESISLGNVCIAGSWRY